jgi:hypothetical protein
MNRNSIILIGIALGAVAFAVLAGVGVASATPTATATNSTVTNQTPTASITPTSTATATATTASTVTATSTGTPTPPEDIGPSPTPTEASIDATGGVEEDADDGTPTSTPSAIRATISPSLRVISATWEGDQVTLILQADEAQDVAISEIQRKRSGGSSSFDYERRYIGSGRTKVTLSGELGVSVVNQECAERGSCKNIWRDGGGSNVVEEWFDVISSEMGWGLGFASVVLGVALVIYRENKRDDGVSSGVDIS